MESTKPVDGYQFLDDTTEKFSKGKVFSPVVGIRPYHVTFGLLLECFFYVENEISHVHLHLD